MIIIGERINASNRTVAEVITNRNEELIANLAKAQAEAGADFIDVNAGSGQRERKDQVADMEWLVDAVQSATDKPLAIDSDIPQVIEAALRRYQGDEVLINSVNAEPEKLKSVGCMAAGRQAKLVALAMGAEGIPRSVEERLVACETIMTQLTRLGIKEEQIYFDLLVLPVSVDSKQAMITLETIKQVKARYPRTKTVIGLSNISYGLPNRKLLNRAFLVIASYIGLDAVIIDPLDAKAMSLIKAMDVLTGQDPQCRSYLRTYRRGALVD